MKKLILIAMAFIGLTATAQERGRHQDKSMTDKKGEQFKNMSAQDVATLQTKKMTLDLNLTEAQQQDVYTIELAHAEERKAKQEERKKARENTTQEKPDSEEKFARMNNHLDKRIAHKNKMKSILNSDQFEKWEKSQKRRGMKRAHKKRRSKR